MSGFVGILSPHLQDADKSLLDACATVISSCCKDYQGRWSSDQADLRFGWLKTAEDTTNEELPFSMDGNIRIVGDVRLDNRTRLIKQLSQYFSGLTTATPDAYLVLYAYKQWKEQCLQYLSGDFAFAIWNEAENYLFCARDHFGIIPFYYSLQDDKLFFTNFFHAIKPITHLMDSLDEEVLKDYLTIGVNCRIEQTIYKQIKKLPPAHQLMYKNGQLSVVRYWETPVDIKPIRYKNNTVYAEHFYHLFEQSVRDRLRNSNAACSLSGGMDSSAIAATAKNILTATYGNDSTLLACNIRYDYLVSEQEGYFADLTAKHLGIPLKKYVAEDYMKNIAKPLNAWIPEPAVIPDATAENQILSDIEPFANIYFTGFGGDPMFEYGNIATSSSKAHRRKFQPIQDQWNMYRTFGFYTTPLFQKVKNWLALAAHGKKRTEENQMVMNTHQASTNVRSIYALSENPYWAALFETFHPGFSNKKVKVRQPFFSLDLYLFMLALPPHILFQKSLLRMAMEPFLPAAVTKRSKTPLFGNPHNQNLQNEEIRSALQKEMEHGNTFLTGKMDTTTLLADLNNPQESTTSHKTLLNILSVLSWRNAWNI
ncbi:asparagine synthase (glutamine-hydrolysing) [Chitinophaga dinghuensis]|uniref:asparagine synthase (glutamine-hydrolyzing) n=1 Tax=Chitinophaga dinghuensis TaxID=1539050 RepID=A0A327VW40_9BACT|nr:asparagine synthase-related protein [Chitinophaga dinghuensis]RAJ80159.1 asparagine synthase (glutamine-hydrolysing) [Chitinophaga dinghuensis]